MGESDNRYLFRLRYKWKKIRNKQQYELLDGSGRPRALIPFLLTPTLNTDPVQILRGPKYSGITAPTQIIASTKRTQPQVMKNQQARDPKY